MIVSRDGVHRVEVGVELQKAGVRRSHSKWQRARQDEGWLRLRAEDDRRREDCYYTWEIHSYISTWMV